MRKLILDTSVWRCGGYGNYTINKKGYGETSMLNKQGYMCCLGQFAKQVGVPDSYLLDNGSPLNVSLSLKQKKKKSQYDPLFVNGRTNTPLSTYLMEINDDQKTTTEQKILKIKKELLKHNVELEVVEGNGPKKK